MSIADKFIVVADNIPKVYEAGRKAGGDYESAYNDGYEIGYANGETTGYNNGYTDGVASVPNLFEYATQPTNVYTSSPFPDGSEFEINLPIVTNITGLFWATKGLKKITVKGNAAGNLVTIDYAFRELPSVETVDLIGFNCKARRANQVFYLSRKLKNILGTLDFSEAVGYVTPFGYCEALEEVRFKESSLLLSISFAHSSKLSAESVQSIIDGLATVETAQTLTLNSAIVLTDEQKAQISSKNWTLVQ